MSITIYVHHQSIIANHFPITIIIINTNPKTYNNAQEDVVLTGDKIHGNGTLIPD